MWIPWLCGWCGFCDYMDTDSFMMWISWWWYVFLDDMDGVDFLMMIWTPVMMMMWTRFEKTNIKRELTHFWEISTFFIVSIVVSLWVSCLCISCFVVFVLPGPPSDDCRYIMKTTKVWKSLEMNGRTMWREDLWLDRLWTQRE